jgi:hypothetical protein
VQDLALETLLQTMARDDQFIHDVALRALLTSWPADAETILYRQAITQDAVNNPAVLRELYGLTVEAMENKRKHFFGTWGRYPSSLLYGAIEMMQLFVGILRRLRGIAGTQAARFASEGFRVLFAMLERELTDEYLAQIEAHLVELKFRRGVLLSAELETGRLGDGRVAAETARARRETSRFRRKTRMTPTQSVA